MNGPLALKQQRDQLAFILKEKRANDKAKNEEIRKAQLHQLKMRDAGGGAAVMVPMAPPMMNNPEAGASDTVPAMLTPGEAVIPAPAAQHPRNKPVIEALVNEGRMANQGYSSGALKVPPMSGYAGGSGYVGEKPAVQGYDGGVFQNWLNATMAQESTYGNDPNTWKNDGHVGLYQLSKGNFESLKKRGDIPKDYDYLNPAHNTEASMKLADEVWKTADGDPEKASAIWYSGPKAIDKKTGEIKAFKDPKNPKAPDTIGYVSSVKGTMSRATPAESVSPLSAGAIVPESKLTPQQIEGLVQPSTFSINPYSDDSNLQIPQPLNVATDSPVINSANIVRPNDTGSMRLDNVDNDPRRTDVLPLVDPNRMTPQEIERAALAPPSVQQPTGREVLIAKQDLANSTDRDVRVRAQAVLDRANGIQPPVVVPPRTIMDARDAMAMNPPPDSRGNVIDKISEWGEVTYRKETTEEAVKGIDKRLSELDQNNPINKYEGIALQKRKEDLLQEQAAREGVLPVDTGKVPPVKDNSPGRKIAETGSITGNAAAEAAINIVKERPEVLDRLATDLPVMDVNTGQISPPDPKKPGTWWENLGDAFGKMFSAGEGGLFADKDFIKFGILLAGGLLTGGSFAGSLRYAGLYALQSADKREAATAKAKAESAKDSRERYQQLRTSVLKDMDTLSTQSRNEVTSLLNKASKAKSNDEGAALMEQALAVMEKADTSSTKLKDPVAGYMYVPGRGQVAVTYRYNDGVPEIQTAPGVYAPIPPNASVESKTDYNSEVNNLQKDIEAKVAPMLARLYEGEEFNSEQEARRLAVNIGLIRSELPEMSRPDFVRAAEMTIRSAVETSKMNGSEITEEGLRKALYGSSIIQLRRSNADMYTYKDSKGSRKPVDATYQSIIGKMYTEKRDSMIKDNPNYNLGMAAEDFENQYKKLPDKVKKPFESLGNEPDNKAPGYLHWLKSIS